MYRLNFNNWLGQFKKLFLPKTKKVLFEHVPKCGGTTVNNYLRSHYLDKKIFAVDASNPNRSAERFISLSKKERYSYDLVCGHGAHQLRGYVHPKTIGLTILRDPVDRIISHYYYVIRTPEHYLYDKVVANKMSLLEYATSNISNELQNDCVCRFLGIAPKEAEKSPDKAVTDAYSVLKRDYTAVGILEKFNQSMDLFAQKAGFNKKFKARELNKTSKRPKKEEIDKSALKAIKKANKLDMGLYNLVKEHNLN